MRVTINFNYKVELGDCNIETMVACFKKVLILFLQDFVMRILNEFATQYMNQKTQPFACDKCGSDSNFTWKTRHAKDTRISTIFVEIIIGQMQVKCKSCGKKMYITRKLLDGCADNMMLAKQQFRIDQFSPKTGPNDSLSYELHAML